jgi:hypothetical protein
MHPSGELGKALAKMAGRCSSIMRSRIIEVVGEAADGTDAVHIPYEDL